MHTFFFLKENSKKKFDKNLKRMRLLPREKRIKVNRRRSDRQSVLASHFEFNIRFHSVLR